MAVANEHRIYEHHDREGLERSASLRQHGGEANQNEVIPGHQPSEGGVRWMSSVWPALVDACLLAVAVAALSALMHIWRWHKLVVGWREIVAAFVLYLSAAVLIHRFRSDKPKYFPLLILLLPSGHDRPILGFLIGCLRVIIFAALFALVVEMTWNIHLVGQTNGRIEFRPHWIEWEFWTGLGIALGWRVWFSIHTDSAVAATQIANWRFLTDWAISQKWVTLAAFGLMFGVYAADFFNESHSQFVQDLNTKVIHFQFLGSDFKAERIFRYEALGFIVGIAAVFLYKISAPTAFRSEGAHVRDAVRRTIMQCGRDVFGPHFAGTLELYRDLLSQKQEWAHHDWQSVNSYIGEVKDETKAVPARIRSASFAVALFPDDDNLLMDLCESYFLFSRRARRFVIFGMLLTAEVLTGLPVLIRTLLLFFPRLAEDPHTWSMSTFLPV